MNKYTNESKVGLVVGFKSKPYFSVNDCIFLESKGINVIYLYGSADLCLRDFLAREKGGRSASHWIKHNLKIYLFYEENKEKFSKFFKNTFTKSGEKVNADKIFEL